MLNVIALRPAQISQPRINPNKPSTNPRHHVLTEAVQRNSGRLDCGEEVDVEVSQLDIYAAR
jgi:hypothetical protein